MSDLAALQLLVPAAAPLLDAVRGLPGVALLEPPHVSLGYPWRTAADADRELVAAAAARVAPFQVHFPVVTRFAPDARGRVLVHLAPQDDAPFRRLAALVSADLGQVHLSVARVLAGADVDAVVAAVVGLVPLVCTVRELELTVQRDGVWQPGERFPLAG